MKPVNFLDARRRTRRRRIRLRRTLAALAAIIALSALVPSPAACAAPPPFDRLRFMTEISPPDNYLDNGVLTGVFADALDLAMGELGAPKPPVEVLPWARAYQRLLDTPDTVLFAVARLPEREALFKWAGPVRSGRFVLLAKKSRKIRLGKPSARTLAPYRIGTVIHDAGEKLVVDLGHPLERLDRADAFRSLMLKLVNDRIDMIAYGEMAAWGFMRDNRIPPGEYEVVGVLSTTPLCFAFHKDTPPEVVARFQAALDRALRKPGAAERLFRKYGIPSGR
jgi:polar amino acid transport system substrate-binding protein